MSLTAGTILAERFTILDLIGEGGMGVVYRAEQLGLDRIVAVKLMRFQLADNPDLVQRFEREAHSLSLICHRNISTVFAYGVWQEHMPFIAL